VGREGLRALWLAGFGIALRPEVALACAACLDPNDERRGAFLITALVLSALPLAMVGSLVYWLRRRWRASVAGASESSSGPGRISR